MRDKALINIFSRGLLKKVFGPRLVFVFPTLGVVPHSLLLFQVLLLLSGEEDVLSEPYMWVAGYIAALC